MAVAHDGNRAESGATEAMHHKLRRQCRLAAGHKPEPSAAIIDSQSVKGAETVSRYERLTGHHEAIVYWSMIITMSRRLARNPRPGHG